MEYFKKRSIPDFNVRSLDLLVWEKTKAKVRTGLLGDSPKSPKFSQRFMVVWTNVEMEDIVRSGLNLQYILRDRRLIGRKRRKDNSKGLV